MAKPVPTSFPGSFEYIEAKIRLDAAGTAFGDDFEWLCQWFLLHAPRYRGQFDKVWLWEEWPDRWGADAGIDIVARTHSGELWAIQSKADHPDRAVPKREIDSFLSESNRPEFAYRLLMATTDDIGATARRTLQGQEKPVGLVLRGHFLTESLQWPVRIGGTSAPLQRWEPRPHQRAAIKAVINGLRDHDRGRLIMACGTGKTLTALWITESLKSSLSLVLVPSLSLVQQNLAEWGRHSARDFDTLVVCSDESVVTHNQDTAVQSTADLGVKVTTDPIEIRRFLSRRRNRPAVVFATYQSSDRIAAAQIGKAKSFDLAICDEAHRLAGHAGGLFATVLDSKKIKARRRLFMTATPRYFKDHVKKRAAELEYELVSMDDGHVFGPEFHVLTFHEAISTDPPLLTDYQVVVIGVTDREAKAWADEARLVRTAEGLSTDARTLASQIGLAKAMKKYDLRKIITFHSSVPKAARFVDPTVRDSLPAVIPHMTRSARPSGTLWTKHISGHTPAGQRATLLKGLGDLPENTRGILSNCACLGEGVDVPVLDGVAFIDPKRSMVDIVQAVGRVIRKAEGKQIGTIVIPVFIDEAEDADHILSQSAFEPVWQVLKALRAHDRRLADELDQLRLSLGTRSNRGVRIKLPANIRLDVPHLLLRNFEQAFYVRTVEQSTDKPKLSIEQILAWADDHYKRHRTWPSGRMGTIEASPDDTWTAVNLALHQGLRGLPGQASLAMLLAKYRKRRHHLMLRPFSEKTILEWADRYFKEHRRWPSKISGPISNAPEETWGKVNGALKSGLRGFPGGSSLPEFLAAHVRKQHPNHRTQITERTVLNWAKEFMKRHGDWPTPRSGDIPGTNDESWSKVHEALRRGRRGLKRYGSIARFLHEKAGVRHSGLLVELSEDQIVNWAQRHYSEFGEWPNRKSGLINDAPGETWQGVESSLTNASRGLARRMSLSKLLYAYFGVGSPHGRPCLMISEILKWADHHFAATGAWPTPSSGRVLANRKEEWSRLHDALRKGARGLPGGSSLSKLLSEERNVRSNFTAPQLSESQILDWANAHFKRTGKWPTRGDGVVQDAKDESWQNITAYLSRGGRGLRGGTSLPKLLAQHHDVPIR